MPEARVISRPGVCGGEACILGTRVTVWSLVLARRRGRTEEALLEDEPALDASDLDAAWDYFRQRPVEVERAIWRNAVAARHPAGQPVPAWMLIQGKLLGLPEAELRQAFSPPLTQADLDAAWRAYREGPGQAHRQIAESGLAW